MKIVNGLMVFGCYWCDMDHVVTWEVYGEGLPPLSDGRILLSEMMADYCEQQWGMKAFQVLRALEGFGATDQVYSIFSTVGFLSGLFRSGDIPTFTRRFGGGDVEPLPRERWEIDNPVSRFIQSAVDPERWTQFDADPTAWIFVDQAAYEAFMAEWCRPADEPVAVPTAAGPSTETTAPDPGDVPAPPVVTPPANDAPVPAVAARAKPRSFINRDEVIKRTKLSRSTIYRRMEDGSFPQSIRLGTNMVAWYEDEIDDWIASPNF